VVVVVVAVMWNGYIVGAWKFASEGRTTWRRMQSVRTTVSEIAPSLDLESPRRVLLCVEPTPFNYISGYANRFQEMLKYLKEAGDNTHIITADCDTRPPSQFLGYPITTQRGFNLPMYKQVTCTFDFACSIPKIIKSFQPDLMHVSTPSAIVFPATLWAKLFKIPLVMSYHTDLVGYVRSYLPPVPGLNALAKMLIKFFLSSADLVLCTSPQLRDEMVDLGISRVDVWQKGINTEVFNPEFRDSSMRDYLSQENPDAPLLLYVGRVGTEKKLNRLRNVLDKNPGCRLAIVGKGPADDELREFFKGYPVFFAGQMTGESLSKAFASADIFVMPSDTETLGFVVMEALASGVPAVGVRAGGLVDIIQNEWTGYLADNDENMVDFSNKVQELVQNVEKRKKFSENAISWTKNWSWEAATSKLRNIQYKNAIELHRSLQETKNSSPQ
jgi:sulfoquinovosyltransferase